MPAATYEQLLIETMPARIDNDEQYEQIAETLGRLLPESANRTPDETKLMDLLIVLIEDYDRRHALPPENITPADMLQFLMEHAPQRTLADLAPVFGDEKQAAGALSGERPISADEARLLGKMFAVQPGLFI